MRAIASVVVCLVLSTTLFAQQLAQKPQQQQHSRVIKQAPTTCPNDPVLATDGRTSNYDQIYANPQYYLINVKAGHAYAVEIWDDSDATAGIAPTILVLQGDCQTPIAVSDTTAMEPDLHGGFAKRVSWVQNSDATLNVELGNPDPNNSYVYNIRVTDLTLHSPRWSTVAGFSTHYGLLNNTSVAISGVLTLTSVTTQQTYLTTINVPAHSEVFVAIPSDKFNVPVGQYGFADFQFAGSPGAITADGYFQTVSNGIFSIAPTTFGPVNYQH